MPFAIRSIPVLASVAQPGQDTPPPDICSLPGSGQGQGRVAGRNDRTLDAAQERVGIIIEPGGACRCQACQLISLLKGEAFNGNGKVFGGVYKCLERFAFVALLPLLGAVGVVLLHFLGHCCEGLAGLLVQCLPPGHAGHGRDRGRSGCAFHQCASSGLFLSLSKGFLSLGVALVFLRGGHGLNSSAIEALRYDCTVTLRFCQGGAA